MKKLVLFSALLIAGLGMNAQSSTKTETAKETNDPAARADKQTNRMVKELSLTADQQTKAHAINLKIDNEIAASPDKKSQLNEQRKTEINAILTPEQQTKFKDMVEGKNKKTRQSK